MLLDQFAKSFELPEHNEPEALRKMRGKFWERFLQVGLPDSSHEAYQYVSLTALKEASFEKAQNAESCLSILPECRHMRVVFVNGYFRQDLSDVSQLPKGCMLMPLKQAFISFSTLLSNRFQKLLKEERDPFALLNAARHQEGAFLYIGPKVDLRVPIEIVSVIETSQERAWIMPRLHLFVGRSSEVKCIINTEAFSSGVGLDSSVFDFELEDDAKVHIAYTDLTTQKKQPLRLSAFRASLKRHSQLQAVELSDSELSRRDWRVLLAGTGAEAELAGLWFLADQKETHTHIVVEHQEPHTRSLQLFKGVLDDRAQSSFQGKIVVEQNALKTEAYQLNNNLVLSDLARAQSKPNLEIFADDVKASHGATVGQLDKEQLFYLKARGIGEKLARSMLIRGFCEEIVARISPTSLHHIVEKKLATFGAA